MMMVMVMVMVNVLRVQKSWSTASHKVIIVIIA